MIFPNDRTIYVGIPAKRNPTMLFVAEKLIFVYRPGNGKDIFHRTMTIFRRISGAKSNNQVQRLIILIYSYCRTLS